MPGQSPVVIEYRANKRFVTVPDDTKLKFRSLFHRKKFKVVDQSSERPQAAVYGEGTEYPIYVGSKTKDHNFGGPGRVIPNVARIMYKGKEKRKAEMTSRGRRNRI
ncbi:MAG TPA: hypothetical protein VM077_00185 [Candidatus Limnocylindrales bacterium]|nr:hypothetical protein [Candidatus Limnocylindrales bacterium]